jgi:hypothetical protein
MYTKYTPSTALCSVCKTGLHRRHKQISSRIVTAKYSASQNFFYSKDIADMLDSTDFVTEISVPAPSY